MPHMKSGPGWGALAVVAIVAVMLVALAFTNLPSLFLTPDQETPPIPPHFITNNLADPPMLKTSLDDDQPLPDPNPVSVPENSNKVPPPPGPNDLLSPPPDAANTVALDWATTPPSSYDVNTCLSLNLHQKINNPEYRGNVTNVIIIKGTESSDVTGFVWIEHVGVPSYSIPCYLDWLDHDGASSACLLGLSVDGVRSIGYSWTPRQASEWWLPINIAINKAGTFTITIAAYDSATGTKLCVALTITITIGEGDDKTYLWERPNINGMWTNASVQRGPYGYYAGGPIPIEPTYSGRGGSGLETETLYYFSVSAPATVKGMEWFKSNLELVDPGFTGNDKTYTLDREADAPFYIVEITNPDGITTDDVWMFTAQFNQLGGERTTSPEVNTNRDRYNPNIVDFIQVDDHTIRGVLSAQPWAYYRSFGPAGANHIYDMNSVNESFMRALCFNAIEFHKDGVYEMSLYLAGVDNGAISKEESSGVMYSPFVQKAVPVGNQSESHDWTFYSDSYPKWMAYINQANDQTCWASKWIYSRGPGPGWYNGTAVIEASVDNGSQFVTVDSNGKVNSELGSSITFTADSHFTYFIGKFPHPGEYKVTLTAYDKDTGQQITGSDTFFHRAVLLEDASETSITPFGEILNNIGFNRTMLLTLSTNLATLKVSLVYPEYIITITDGTNTATFDTSTVSPKPYSSADQYKIDGTYPMSWWLSPGGLPWDPKGHYFTIDFGGPGTYIITVKPVQNGELAGNIVQHTVTIS
jgi:hypothetical protein